MAIWYVGSAKWSSVTAWSATATITAGALVRQLATPTLNQERVFVAIIAGTTNSAEPTWVITKGAKTTDNSVTWQEVTGQAAINGDITNTPDWNAVKNTAVALGYIIKDIAASTYFVCTSAGTAGNGSEPTWATTAGATTADNTATWTSIGPVSNFVAFGGPHARCQNATTATWGGAGDTFYISATHAEIQGSGSLQIVSPGTLIAPCRFICISNSSVSSPVVATTASVATSSGSTIDIVLRGFAYFYGMTFNMNATFSSQIRGNVGGTTSETVTIFENCTIQLSGGAGAIVFPSANTAYGAYSEFRNCTFLFASTSHYIQAGGGLLKLINCSIAPTGSVPGTPFNISDKGRLELRDCDLSRVTGSLVSMNATMSSDVLITNCKLASSYTPTVNNPSSLGGTKVRIHSSSGDSTNYKFYERDANGVVTHETTNVLTGGASDGSTTLSFAATSSVNATYFTPLEFPQIVQWNGATGSSKTATIEVASNSTLTNGDLWIEVEYLGSSSTPQGSIISTKKANILSSNANLTSSSATWGGSTTTKQNISATFTPQMVGPIKVRVYLAKPSTVVYVNPLIALV